MSDYAQSLIAQVRSRVILPGNVVTLTAQERDGLLRCIADLEREVAGADVAQDDRDVAIGIMTDTRRQLEKAQAEIARQEDEALRMTEQITAVARQRDALREELKQVRDLMARMAKASGRDIDALRESLRVAENARDNWKDMAGENSADCSALRERLEAIREAIDKEEELNGVMPDSLWVMCSTREGAAEVMRAAVRATKRNISAALTDA
jgi:chromosome segregation ATPase